MDKPLKTENTGCLDPNCMMISLQHRELYHPETLKTENTGKQMRSQCGTERGGIGIPECYSKVGRFVSHNWQYPPNQGGVMGLDEMLDNFGTESITSYRADGSGEPKYKEAKELAKSKLTKYIEQEIKKARIDENNSLLSVAEHEIELGDKCHNHEKHTAQCYACRKRKMYVEYSKDWKKSIDERIKELGES